MATPYPHSRQIGAEPTGRDVTQVTAILRTTAARLPAVLLGRRGTIHRHGGYSRCWSGSATSWPPRSRRPSGKWGPATPRWHWRCRRAGSSATWRGPAPSPGQGLRRPPRAIAEEVARRLEVILAHPPRRPPARPAGAPLQRRGTRFPQLPAAPWPRPGWPAADRPQSTDAARAGLKPEPHRPKRSSSNTPTSTPTRRPTSATSATPCSATRWCAACASWAAASRCRTTSTTPACRSRTWWWGSCTCPRRRWLAAASPVWPEVGGAPGGRARRPAGVRGPRGGRDAGLTGSRRRRLRRPVLGALPAGDPPVRRGPRIRGAPLRGPARHRGRLPADLTLAGAVERLAFRTPGPRAPTAGRRGSLRPWRRPTCAATWPPWAASGSPTTCCRTSRTSCTAASGARLRAAAGSGRHPSRGRGQERRLLGHVARGVGRVRRHGRRRQDPGALQRHRDLHRQGHRVPALEARPAARPRRRDCTTSATAPSTASRRRALPPRCATATGNRTLFRTHRRHRASARRSAHSAPAPRSTTSSTCASPTPRRWSRRRSASSATPRRPTARFTSPTRWWRSRRRPCGASRARRASTSVSVRRTWRSRSSRCPGGAGSA